MKTLKCITIILLMFTFMLISLCWVTLSFADKYVTRQITHNTTIDYTHHYMMERLPGWVF